MAMLIIPKDEDLWKQGFRGDEPESADWLVEDDETKVETLGEARKRFVSFGPLLDAEEALHYALETEHQVMTFGYGESMDDDGFTSIDPEELDEAIKANGAEAVMRLWGPFAPWLGADGDDTSPDNVDHLAGRHDEIMDVECTLCNELYEEGIR